jgi:hypothetical protein
MVSKTKPPEEFYDSQADPHNVTNVIAAPEHQERIKAMREAMDQWLRETGDLAEIRPESKLVREKLWPPNGEQPATAAPQATIKDGVLTITAQPTARRSDGGNAANEVGAFTRSR